MRIHVIQLSFYFRLREWCWFSWDGRMVRCRGSCQVAQFDSALSWSSISPSTPRDAKDSTCSPHMGSRTGGNSRITSVERKMSRHGTHGLFRPQILAVEIQRNSTWKLMPLRIRGLRWIENWFNFCPVWIGVRLPRSWKANACWIPIVGYIQLNILHHSTTIPHVWPQAYAQPLQPNADVLDCPWPRVLAQNAIPMAMETVILSSRSAGTISCSSLNPWSPNVARAQKKTRISERFQKDFRIQKFQTFQLHRFSVPWSARQAHPKLQPAALASGNILQLHVFGCFCDVVVMICDVVSWFFMVFWCIHVYPTYPAASATSMAIQESPNAQGTSWTHAGAIFGRPVKICKIYVKTCQNYPISSGISYNAIGHHGFHICHNILHTP